VRLDDDGFVQDQYASTAKLQTRIAVWQPAAEGSSPQDVAISRLAERSPARVLEVGPGTGAFAERCRAELRCEVVALDRSAEMVRETAARGVTAIVGDVTRLPFADGEFDCAVAAWMLYHVPDLDTAIGELARVLAPGGRLVAITNGAEHLRELYAAVGAAKLESSFSRENGAERLARHFAPVERTDLRAQAVFADRAAAAAYLATLGQGELAERLPDFTEPFVASGAPTVFVADKAPRPPN
jgi:SAM-dependent methyltransferase